MNAQSDVEVSEPIITHFAICRPNIEIKGLDVSRYLFIKGEMEIS